jgi:hypothetical protein
MGCTLQGILVMLDMHRLEDDEKNEKYDGNKLQGFLVRMSDHIHILSIHGPMKPSCALELICCP